MDKPKMIMFDYGGTLLHEPQMDFVRGEREVFRHVIRNPRNLTPEEVSQFETDHFASLQEVRELGYEATEIQMLRFKYEYQEIELDISYEEAEQILWDHTSPMTEKAKMPHVSEMLAFLRENGIRTAVISNLGWTGPALKRRLQMLLPEHSFEFVIASSEYGVRKPDRRIFELALRKAHLKPEEVWYCGDTFANDIEGAGEAGMVPIFYQGTTTEGPKRPRIGFDPSVPYAVIDDWRELIALLQGNGQ